MATINNKKFAGLLWDSNSISMTLLNERKQIYQAQENITPTEIGKILSSYNNNNIAINIGLSSKLVKVNTFYSKRILKQKELNYYIFHNINKTAEYYQYFCENNGKKYQKFTLISAKKSLINDITQLFGQINLKTERIEAEIVALAHFVRIKKQEQTTLINNKLMRSYILAKRLCQ